MTLFKNATLLLLFLVLTLAQNPSSRCPSLCSTNCLSTTTTCSSCYSDFSTTSLSNSTCGCPSGLYLDSSFYCKPCPISCVSCSGYSVCLSCISGYMLQNNKSCAPNTTNQNGWVTKNVSYLLSPSDFTGVSVLVVLVNGSAFNLTNSAQSLGNYTGNCSQLPGYYWLGGYKLFSYSAQVIKTMFDLPPHQWINVMFQAVLIDNWLNNTLLL